MGYNIIMSSQYLYNYGVNLLKNNPNIKNNRKIFNFNTTQIQTLPMIANINTPFIHQLITDNNLPITKNMTCQISYKHFSINMEMGWHQDDASVYKHSNKHCAKYNVQKYNIFTNSKQPIYTMVLYMNNYGEDFYGGEFCFVDVEIKPIKGLGIFFDSKEIHRVKKILKGTRQSCLIKFYI